MSNSITNGDTIASIWATKVSFTPPVTIGEEEMRNKETINLYEIILAPGKERRIWFQELVFAQNETEALLKINITSILEKSGLEIEDVDRIITLKGAVNAE